MHRCRTKIWYLISNSIQNQLNDCTVIVCYEWHIYTACFSTLVAPSIWIYPFSLFLSLCIIICSLVNIDQHKSFDSCYIRSFDIVSSILGIMSHRFFVPRFSLLWLQQFSGFALFSLFIVVFIDHICFMSVDIVTSTIIMFSPICTKIQFFIIIFCLCRVFIRLVRNVSVYWFRIDDVIH